MKREWLELPKEERVGWYKNEIGSLANFLELREPFTKEEKKHGKNKIRYIRDRVAVDNNATNDPVFSKVLDKLPEPRSDASDWIPKLYGALSEL